jgi:uncharacterized oligopeptide transporter (OPT) family protein
VSASVKRVGLYVGCMWLIIAAFLGFWTLFAFAWGGPLAGLLFLALAATCLGMVAALWTGRGGRRAALVSLVLGLVFLVAGAAGVVVADPSAATSNLVLALLGVAIVLASAFLLRVQRTSRTEAAGSANGGRPR